MLLIASMYTILVSNKNTIATIVNAELKYLDISFP